LQSRFQKKKKWSYIAEGSAALYQQKSVRWHQVYSIKCKSSANPLHRENWSTPTGYIKWAQAEEHFQKLHHLHLIEIELKIRQR